MESRKKILILRFSSLGDIVLSSPLIRSLKQARPGWELHYFTKPGFAPALAHNPHLDRLLLLGDLGAQLRALREERYDHVLDLHGSLRSLRIRLALGRPASVLDKRNFDKWMLVRRKRTPRPISHIVERYCDTLRPLGVEADGGGLDFFLPGEQEDEARQALAAAGLLRPDLLAVALGAQHRTKRWIPGHFREALNRLGRPVLLLGGQDARADADEIRSGLRVPCYDSVGKSGLLLSAALMRQAREVLTHDSGFMHIAAAFQMPAYVIWGSTVPALGMTPWRSPHANLEVQGLGCRPCSRLGFDTCPQGHFRCMRDLSPDQVAAAIEAGAAR
jgi:ADP-heptose:LPS heptosyltransferase